MMLFAKKKERTVVEDELNKSSHSAKCLDYFLLR